MRRTILTAILCLSFFHLAAQDEKLVHSFSDGLRFDEGLTVYKNSVLVSNFGSDIFDPLNNQGKGYIASVSLNELKVFIPTDGYLSAPKGMAVHQHHLFVADVNKVVVYNLRKIKDKPLVIDLPAGEMFVNDIAALGDILLVTVTNTGNIFGIDASDINSLGKPALIGRIPGANGIIVHGNQIYCASYNPSGVARDENVIYCATIASDGGQVDIRPLIKGLKPAQYDGLAITEDGKTLYFSSWGDTTGGEIFSWALDGQTPVRKIDFGVEFGGPADICIFNSMLYIPDLVNSKLYRFNL